MPPTELHANPKPKFCCYCGSDRIDAKPFVECVPALLDQVLAGMLAAAFPAGTQKQSSGYAGPERIGGK